MAYKHKRKKIPYSKMTLAKLKEIETGILYMNPDLESRLSLYDEEEKKLIKLRDMGDDPHCDHAYPVSKGGLSKPKNMVYVCSDCNIKKTNLTLSQFIKKCGFQRLEIEQRLEKLEKDY